MTQEELSEKLCQDLVNQIDALTLDHGLSLSQAAQTYREVASEMTSRAQQLEEEAGQDQ